MKKYILSLDEMDLMIKDIAKEFTNGVIILRGDLAAGKTTFVKKIVSFLEVEQDVTSPTFSLQHCYGGTIFHYDIYNHGLDHFISLGMLEELERGGIHLIEWGDERLIQILSEAGIDVMSIDIEKISNEKREYTICTY
jgi:tRNA threonylcarbamoyladenosine biosynthesis protein TsaE